MNPPRIYAPKAIAPAMQMMQEFMQSRRFIIAAGRRAGHGGPAHSISGHNTPVIVARTAAEWRYRVRKSPTPPGLDRCEVQSGLSMWLRFIQLR
jgi:hypothetical protein